MIIILKIFQVVIGLLIGLFIPGFLLVILFFKELSFMEKIGLSFVLSIAVDIIVGLFLGYNETMKNLTGGITALNVWVYLSGVSLILLVINLIKYRGFRKIIKILKEDFRKEF